MARAPSLRAYCLGFSSAGLDDVFVTAVVNVRNALDKCLERAMCDEEFPSSRMSTALRCVRTGRFDRLRLMHLIDAEDSGASTEQPFKGLEASGSPSEDLRACLTRLRRAIKYGTPSIANKASDWIDEFEKMLCKALKRGVSTKACGKFYRACMFKVSAPVLRYVGGAGRNCAATFDMAFLKEQSEARDEFKDAFYTRSRADDADDSDDEEIAPPAKAAGRKRDRKGNPTRFPYGSGSDSGSDSDDGSGDGSGSGSDSSSSSAASGSGSSSERDRADEH